MSLPPLSPELAPPDPRPRIVQEIATALADWPLYRPYRYEGDLWEIKNHYYRLSFPRTLRLYCVDENCKATQVWEKESTFHIGGNTTIVSEFTSVFFRCRNCQASKVHYFLHVQADQVRGEIVKVGQWPPLSREADPIVVSCWNKADKLLYREAMTLRNANKGVGALPYLRRIIENHMNDILNLIADANRRASLPNFDAVAFERVSRSHAFSDKLDFARDYLPQALTPAGSPNPIGRLYELISDGLHQRTEEECVEIFDDCKVAFEFVIKKLTEAKREDEAYIEAIRKLRR